MVDVTVGSLNEESIRLVRPGRHSWWGDGVGWIREMLRWGTGPWMLRHGAVEGHGTGRERPEEGAWLRMDVEGDGRKGGN